MNFGVVDRHVNGGMATHAVDGSGSPRSSADFRGDCATEDDAEGREVSRRAKLARRRHRDSASNHSPKERRSQEYVNHRMFPEGWICKLAVTQV